MVFITISFTYERLMNHYLDQATFRTHYHKKSLTHGILKIIKLNSSKDMILELV